MELVKEKAPPGRTEGWVDETVHGWMDGSFPHPVRVDERKLVLFPAEGGGWKGGGRMKGTRMDGWMYGWMGGGD